MKQISTVLSEEKTGPLQNLRKEFDLEQERKHKYTYRYVCFSSKKNTRNYKGVNRVI